jgi:hypothetical protein
VLLYQHNAGIHRNGSACISAEIKSNPAPKDLIGAKTETLRLTDAPSLLLDGHPAVFFISFCTFLNACLALSDKPLANFP